MSIRLLIVDDSALIRKLLKELLSTDAEIEVVGTASDPIIARERIKALNPDVITLDIEMPRMDGLSFLEKIMRLRPMPVIVVSTMTQRGVEAGVRALELGALDYVGKPVADIRLGANEWRDELVAKVKAAAKAKVRAQTRSSIRAQPIIFSDKPATAGRIIAVGASTGGVEALQELLSALPANAPALLVTQHMPAGFTASFARRLDDRCAVTVIEATDGAQVLPGHVYIAAGNRHLELVRRGQSYRTHVHDGAPVSGHRPSADVLFHSVAMAAGGLATGVILTGMGSDGAAGLLEMRLAGARTFGQDEGSCVVYGMPKVAKEMGAVDQEIPLSRMAQALLR
jgi:two-component system chemotaxis response regulator CheB